MGFDDTIEEHEIAFKVSENKYLVVPEFDKNLNGVEYVRFVDSNGIELVKWTYDEWQESEEQAKEVMGAIMGVIIGNNGLKNLT